MTIHYAAFAVGIYGKQITNIYANCNTHRSIILQAGGTAGEDPARNRRYCEASQSAEVGERLTGLILQVTVTQHGRACFPAAQIRRLRFVFHSSHTRSYIVLLSISALLCAGRYAIQTELGQTDTKAKTTPYATAATCCFAHAHFKIGLSCACVISSNGIQV